MYSLGLDIHQRRSSACILDENGKVVKERQVLGSWGRLLMEVQRWRAELPGPLAVCYEASCGYGYLHDHLRSLAERVVVAHPGHLRLIFRSKRKNDRVDAKKLATLLLLDQVPQVYVPSVEVRGWRALIEYRRRLIAKRTRVKNGLRAVLRGHGVVAPVGRRLWTRAGQTWLREVALPTSAAALQRDLLEEELQHLNAQVLRVEKELNARGRAHPGVQLLRTIPGVGPRTSEAVVAYLDDPKRFRHNKAVGSYFGLVPCQDASAETNRLGHITRSGPSSVRQLVTEAAWQGIRRDPTLRAYFERIQGGDPQRKKIALVATAHYLLRVMQALLRTGQAWREPKAG
jgi:transposase